MCLKQNRPYITTSNRYITGLNNTTIHIKGMRVDIDTPLLLRLT